VYVEAVRARGCLDRIGGPLSPGGAVTRAQFVHILAAFLRPEGSEPEGREQASPFTDLGRDSWALPSIRRAYELGWVKGCGNGLFRPDVAITRAEAVVVLDRAFSPAREDAPGEAASVWEQAPASCPPWAAGSVRAALSLGWLTGDPDGDLRLTDPVTLAEACALIWRAAGTWGLAGDLHGVVSLVDPAERAIFLDTAIGDMRVVIPAGAAVFRNGAPSVVDDLKPLDEVFVVNGRGGRRTVVAAWYADDVGIVETADAGSGVLKYVDRNGVAKAVPVPASATVYVQGNLSDLNSVHVGDRVYVVYSSASGCVRMLGVFRMNVSGKVIEVYPEKSVIVGRVTGGGTLSFKVAEESVLYASGVLAGLEGVKRGDFFQGAVDADGNILFMQFFSIAGP
jgi:hypothetical protein